MMNNILIFASHTGPSKIFMEALLSPTAEGFFFFFKFRTRIEKNSRHQQPPATLLLVLPTNNYCRKSKLGEVSLLHPLRQFATKILNFEIFFYSSVRL